MSECALELRETARVSRAGADPSAEKQRPTVVLIMSASRSGSTILCNVLGQAAGAFGVGELHRL